jgi:hypothetical protein
MMANQCKLGSATFLRDSVGICGGDTILPIIEKWGGLTGGSLDCLLMNRPVDNVFVLICRRISFCPQNGPFVTGGPLWVVWQDMGHQTPSWVLMAFSLVFKASMQV